MSEASRPLLPGGSGNDDSDAALATADIGRRLEEGLSADDPVDFEDLLRLKPDAVIGYLATVGTRKLGTFVTQDVEVLPLMKDGNIWTFGADRIDIDHEAKWKEYLANDNFLSKGFPSKIEVEAHVVTLRNAALPGDRGVLNPLLEKWQDGALATRAFGLPAVQAVIQFKWDKWARRVLLVEFAFYLVWLLAFQVFIIAFQDEDLNLSFRELLHTTRGIVTVSSLITSLAGMAPFLYIEACTLLAYGPQRWLNVWNALDVLTYIFQILISIAYFGRWQLKSDALSILSALQVLLLWWRVQYFARAFQSMRNTFLNTVVAVIKDVWPFLLLLLVTLWGFAGAYYILFRDEQSTHKFDNPWHALTSVFTLMMGDIDVDLFYGSKNPVIGVILLVVFLFVMTMVLLNLLIAIMSESAGRASDDDGTKFLSSRAEMVDELEASLPRWLRRADWYPPYIHILKVNPKSRDSVQRGMLWGANTAETEEAEHEGLKQEIVEMRGEIGELKEMLRAALSGVGNGGSNGGRGGGIISSTISSVGGLLPSFPGASPSK